MGVQLDKKLFFTFIPIGNGKYFSSVFEGSKIGEL